jgi:hypothetical protein
MNYKTEKYGLRKEDTEFIKKLCSAHPEIEKAILYILRQTGEFALASDLEIALCGKNITKKTTDQVMDVIKNDGTNKVWFDIVHYEGLENQELRDYIDDNGIILYQKNATDDDNEF